MRYILVVHGMGKSRKNETVLNVVNRFAEARAQSKERDETPVDVLTLGAAFSQTGRQHPAGHCRYQSQEDRSRPWLEFEHIPLKPGTPDGPFFGGAADSSAGQNLRFVDVHWDDLLQEDYPHVAVDAITWIDCLRGRLGRKTANGKGIGAPHWAHETLRLIRDTIFLVRRVMAFRGLKKIDELIFQDFLGDVQLYGEYSHTRGRAVQRFHELMAKIEEDSKKREERPSYTIIAHSLGTVMSFDALLYAMVKRSLRDETDACKIFNLPFSGFCSKRSDRQADQTDHLDTSWISRVDAFVTLGSPIDKFLVLWWQNYRYLNTTAWMEERLEKRIRHFNYCDEQDPAGHNLDIVSSTEAYQQAFELVEDKVFNRYAWPGVAHVNYWKDTNLFQWILSQAVDNDVTRDSQPQPPRWFDEEIYRKVLMISYDVIPCSIILLNYFTFTWGWYTESWHATALAAVAFAATTLIGRHMIDLTIWWRQILWAKDPELLRIRDKKKKRRTVCPAHNGREPTQARSVSNETQNIPFASDTKTIGEEISGGANLPQSNSKFRKERQRRERHGKHFLLRLWLAAAVFVVLAAISSGHYLNNWPVRWGRLTLFSAIAIATILVWLSFFRSPDVARRKSGKGGNIDASAPWCVDLLCTLVVLSAVLGGWLCVRYFGNGMLPFNNMISDLGFCIASLANPLYKIKDYIDDLSFCVASFCVVSTVVFWYLVLRLEDVRRQLNTSTSVTNFKFKEYAHNIPSSVSEDEKPTVVSTSALS